MTVKTVKRLMSRWTKVYCISLSDKIERYGAVAGGCVVASHHGSSGFSASQPSILLVILLGDSRYASRSVCYSSCDTRGFGCL